MVFYNLNYLIYMLPCFILSLICNIMVKSNFSKYSQIANSRRLTGAQAAQQVLSAHGVTGVRIEPVQGNLTDHFDPRSNVIRLSESVYNAKTVAAVGVACHEAGHAVQHAEGYLPNKIRSVIVPMANFGSRLSWIFLVVGLLLPTKYNFVVIIGIVLFSLSVLFTLITLPVEFNASSRALKTIKETNMLNPDEYDGAKKVLTSAAMTYVAAAATSIAQLLRLLMIANNRRR
ncbi:zinc metallopeptidase [uncultured Ruminococcus sp.]|uniref:zinc metallopeptidase n=1 Tax=uncultured Ruminococcus sp. TaxID=165186 RepID=UPI00292D611F|nr:zinc metallopeptidase [uncultured Ruminococcus sp.]